MQTKGFSRTSKVGDSHEVIRTADDGTDRDHDEIDEGMRNLSAPRVPQTREVHLKPCGKELDNWHDDVFRDSDASECHGGSTRRGVGQSCQTTHHGAIALVNAPVRLMFFEKSNSGFSLVTSGRVYLVPP